MDPTTIRSAAVAEQAWLRGDIAKILLLPAELGGPEVPENIAYVPHEAVDVFSQAIDDLIVVLRKGVFEVSVIPDYRPESFLASTITISAWRPGSTNEFKRVIVVW